MLCCGRTDVGKRRRNNQDSFICETFDNGMMLCIVCDGMGGAAGGGIASGLACVTFADAISEFADNYPRHEKLSRSDERLIKAALLSAAVRANSAVFGKARKDTDLNGMGTTIVAALVVSNILFTLNVGDSRLYLVHEGEIKQITHDHSFVQFLIDQGRMTMSEARYSSKKNIITKALGTDPQVEPDIFVSRLVKKREREQEYVALLCSDGLTNHVLPDEIAHVTSNAIHEKNNRSLGSYCEALIDRANKSGGSDNITAVILTV